MGFAGLFCVWNRRQTGRERKDRKDRYKTEKQLKRMVSLRFRKLSKQVRRMYVIPGLKTAESLQGVRFFHIYKSFDFRYTGKGR